MSNGVADFARIIRQAHNSVLNNVLNSRSVPIRFHKSPGDDNGGDRAIAGLSWQVRAQGFIIQRGGVTGNDGLMNVTVRGGVSTLELLHNGIVVSRYEIRISTQPYDAVTTVTGQKQRLRSLGYQIGHTGPAGNGVDAVNNMEFERSVLDIQVEAGLNDDANVEANTRARMTADAGA
ncbi:MAG: hypothetical protein IH608_05190 [Proteobacteria bacterium]|nr:hypothetical protein [Pseudomonadota bacterium]